MNRSVPPFALAVAAAAFALALAAPAGAVTVKLPDIQVMGAESACSGFTASLSSSGGTVLTCVPATTAPPPANAPQGCTARINNQNTTTLASSGGNVNLSVVCSSPTTLSYDWSKGGVFGKNSSANWSDTLPANTGTSNVTYSYQVKVCNTAGSTSDCVTVPSTPLTAVVPAATSGGSIACASKVLDVNWNAPGRYFTYNAGGFAPTDTFVVRFTAGSVLFSSSYATLTGAEYGSSPSRRIWTLSSSPCDFTTTGKSRYAYNLSGSSSITVKFTVGTVESSVNYYQQLQAGKTYYLNIRNDDGATCYGTGSCDMFIDFYKPSGT